LAGFAVVCSRDRRSPQVRGADLHRLALHLAPDLITPHAPLVFENDGLARLVMNPVAGVRADRRGAAVGAFFEPGDWSAPLSTPLDGSFAMVRHDASVVELLTDSFASRTIWYALTDDAFYASTSQRALVALLGSFRLEAETVTWMLASGYLGPSGGWDDRLRRVPPGTSLRLDRERWTLSQTQRPVEYAPQALGRDEHLARLKAAAFAACRDVDLDGVSWMLPISGGHDSRALLMGLLAAGRRPSCLTWGLASSLSEPGNDAFIARLLASRMSVDHEYFALDPSGEPMRDVFTRFLLAGEGRAEDFSGYTDGMATWRRLFERGVDVIVRGDTPGLGSGQGRAYDPVSAAATRGSMMRATLVSDYPEDQLIHRLDLTPQQLPKELELRPGESLGMYRDRLHNQYKLGVMFAALNDPKCAFVEVVNPLLHRAMVEAVAGLPDELRQWEAGYAEMVGRLAPDVPFDSAHAEMQSSEYLALPATRTEILTELSSVEAEAALSRAALDLIVDALARPQTVTESTRSALRRRVKSLLPTRALRLIPPRARISTSLLAFRAYIAVRMTSLMQRDARALADQPSRTA
jgi:hypothetical protein